MKSADFLTTAEFAKLCGTTKDALILYDRMDILKPKNVAENGYRLYSPEQFFDYDLIMIIKQTGSTLKEIKEYIAKNDINDFLEMFKARQIRLDEQIGHLTRMKRGIESTIRTTEEGLIGPFDIPELVEMDEEYLIATRLRHEKVTLDNVVNSLYDHYLYCDKLPEVIKYPTGSILSRENFLSGTYQESFFYSHSTAPIHSERLLIKPAGQYVRIIARGMNVSFANISETVRNFIDDNKLTLCGDMYVMDLITYFSQENWDNYVFKYMIHVL